MTTGITVNPIEDNIFQWQVLLKDFKEELSNDLNLVNGSYGYDYIELQLDFSMDLYPFFPPSIKVVRPRLLGSLVFAVNYIDILKVDFKYLNLMYICIYVPNFNYCSHDYYSLAFGTQLRV